MGGFGAYQLAGYEPHLFDVVVSIAGYGRGTLEGSDMGWHAPQPESAQQLGVFLDRIAPGLAKAPHVLVVHAMSDRVSSAKDALHIVSRVVSLGGVAEFMEVP